MTIALFVLQTRSFVVKVIVQRKSLMTALCNSLQAFNVVFQKAIDRAEPAEEVKFRVNNLIDCITFSVFIYTTRGLFEKDKLIFTAQVAFQVSDQRLSSLNPLRPNNDLSQTSHYNIKGVSVSEVMRIENMITQVHCY